MTEILVTIGSGNCFVPVLYQALMLQSHSTMGTVQFLAPVWFLARKAKWSARRSFTPVLFSWLHQVTGPVQLDMTVHLWFDRINRRTRQGPPARESSIFFISYGTRTVTVHTHGHVRELTQREFAKILHERRMWLYEAVRAPYGPCTGCSRAVYDL